MHHTQSFGILFKRLTGSLLAGALSAFTLVSQGAIVGPYAPDAATLHLWHLDESAVPSADAAPGGTNLVGLLYGATLGNSSFTGFGTALSTLDGGQDVITAAGRDAGITPSVAVPPGNVTFTYANPADGSFTFEAIVRIDFDPTKNLGSVANGGNGRNVACQILSCESGANGSRIFQFRLAPKGVVSPDGPVLTFENVRAVSGNQPTIYAAIPLTGPEAIVSNGWFHVAVTYNGVPNTSDNIKFYWTAVDPSRTAANQIAITSPLTTLSGPNPLSTAATPPVIGNIGRNITTAGNNFLGLIDEVRISQIARAANQMLFATSEVVLNEHPASLTTAVGLPASFRVSASGQGPISYQWQHQGTNLPGANQFSYSIAAAQFSDAGEYQVIVSNSVNSITSSVATLTIRTASSLTWIGTGGPSWDFSTISWDSDANASADVAFNQGDTVLFNNQGDASQPINLPSVVFPGSVSVTGDNSYTLTSSSGGGITGFSGISKTGAGTLTMDIENTFSGPTTIEAGTLQVGNGAARGSLGTGAVTNNSVLLVNRTGGVTFNNHFAGNGDFTINAGAVTIAGTNTFSGPIVLNAGSLTLANSFAKGPTTDYSINAFGNSTALAVNGGVTFGPGTTIGLLHTSASPDNRSTLTSGTGTNTFGGTLAITGDGSSQFNSTGPASNSLFQITAPVNSPDYTGQLIIRGGGNGLITAPMTLGGKVSKTDAGIWTLASTGNSWVASDVAGGTLRMGVNNAFPSSAAVNITAATAVFDLAGTAQSVSTLTGIGIIGSSSTNADSVISVNPPGLSLFNGVIRDSTGGGTAKVGLTLAGGNLTLAGTNTYTGNTLVNAGTLDLFINGSISNSANIVVAEGATLDASFRTDQTLAVSPAQTLKGNGSFTVRGNIVNNGTIELKVNKSGATLSNDSIAGSSQITFGNTLKLVVTASPALSTNDSFALFSASSYAGSFAQIIPSVPAAGLAWDTSTLATDGVLRIAISTVNQTPTNITAQVTGNALTLSWPESHVGWRLQTQINPITVGLSTNWVDVSGSTTTNRAVFPLNTTNGTVFFRMVYP